MIRVFKGRPETWREGEAAKLGEELRDWQLGEIKTGAGKLWDGRTVENKTWGKKADCGSAEDEKQNSKKGKSCRYSQDVCKCTQAKALLMSARTRFKRDTKGIIKKLLF